MSRAHPVKFVQEGVELEVPEDEYILVVAERAGLALPYSCRIGTCAVCVAHVVGDVDQSEGVMLTNEEKRDGFCLLCIAKPRGPCSVDTSRVP